MVLVFLFLITVTGVSSKIYVAGFASKDFVSPAIDTHTDLEGFSEPKTLAITADGSRDVFAFQSSGCDGTLLIMPIYRNAEDAALLTRWGYAPVFFLEGQIFEKFPSTLFTLSRLWHQIDFNSSASPIVFALAETSGCSLVKKAIPLLQNALALSK